MTKLAILVAFMAIYTGRVVETCGFLPAGTCGLRLYHPALDRR